jgi:hypothetical protein
MFGIIKGILGLGYQKKKIVNVIRVESDEFTVCKPKLVNTRKWAFGERNRIIHYSGKDFFTMDL